MTTRVPRLPKLDAVPAEDALPGLEESLSLRGIVQPPVGNDGRNATGVPDVAQRIGVEQHEVSPLSGGDRNS